MASMQLGATDGIIPYKNAPALISYYLSIVSLLPVVGLPFGMMAVALGIAGLIKRKRQPEVKGSVHAWIGVILGALSSLGYGALVLPFLVASAAGA